MAHGFVARSFFCAFALSLSFSASADAFDDARLSVERHFKSGAEPTVVEAGWTDDWVFKVAVQDNGRSRDGFAECWILPVLIMASGSILAPLSASDRSQSKI